MKRLLTKLAIFTVLGMLFLSTIAEAAFRYDFKESQLDTKTGWYFYTKQKEKDFVGEAWINLKTAVVTPEDTLMVWQKLINRDTRVTLETLFEVDCNRLRYRPLAMTVNEKEHKEIEAQFADDFGEWTYFETSALSTASQECMCGLYESMSR